VSDPSARGSTTRPAWADELALESVGLVARLLRLHLLFGRLLDDVTSAVGIGDADYLVLGLVERSGEGGGSPTRIAEILGRSTGGMTLTLDRLEGMGWVTREPDPADRRRILVRLTPTGLDATHRVRDALYAWEASLDLADRDREQLFASVDALLTLVTDDARHEPAAGSA
jgi:DNA-binding MarR family transcriptional regulator